MSILNVNKINPVGSGSTVTIAGIASVTNNISVGNSVTATTFHGSGANLTSLPAANLTGTLPAISGANLTNLPAQATIANNADNRVITGGSGVNLNGESELTYSTYLNLTRSNSDTNFGDNSAPGGVNGIFVSNSQSTNGVFSAITLSANDTNSTNQSASFIAKSVNGGYTPEVHISSRTNNNTNESNFKITSSRAVEIRYQGNTKLATTSGGVNVTGSVTCDGGVKLWMGNGSRSHNTAVGNGALASASGGDDCTAVGHNAYANGTTGEDNTVVGSHAMDAAVTGNHNCAFGHASLSNLTSGYDNSCYGRLSGLEMTGGYNNTYMGSSAGEKTIGAQGNTFLGYKAGLDITTGNMNVAVGAYSLDKQTETHCNTAVGYASQLYSSGASAGNNTSLGHEALRGASDASPLTGGRNVAIGRGTMEDCRSGYRNTAVGWESLRNINSGYENVCLGYEAGRTISTGNENILIGASAAPSSTSVSREMFIGNGTSGNGANTFYVHSTSGAYNGTNNQHWNQTSDVRIKKNITNFDTGLEVINKLQVRNFEYKTKDEIKSANPELTDALQSMENVLNISGVQKGLIAQEAELVSSAFVTTPSTGVKALVPDEIFWHMLNSIKELSAKNDALEARLATLEGS